MKKLILASYTSLVLVLLLGSCSVDKRLYRPGYNISWNHHSKQVTPEDVRAVADVQKDEIVTPEPEVAVTQPAITEEQELPVTASTDEKPVVAEKKKSILSRMSEIIKEDTPEDEARINAGSKAAAFKSGFKKGLKVLMPDEEAHVLHLAIASFVLGIISLFAYYGAFVLGLLAIIFGAISIHRIRYGGGYRGSTFAWLGLIFGIIAIAATLVIIRVY